MAFLPDGTMFFTEKCHGLSVRQPNGTVTKLLGMKDTKGYASTASDLFCEGQAGMAGVAVDPNFASNRFIYVYSASSLTAPGSNRVMRLKVSDNATACPTAPTSSPTSPTSPRPATTRSVAPAPTTAGACGSAPATASST
jgi:glucose/arabinose dehydrogenase